MLYEQQIILQLNRNLLFEACGRPSACTLGEAAAVCAQVVVFSDAAEECEATAIASGISEHLSMPVAGLARTDGRIPAAATAPLTHHIRSEWNSDRCCECEQRSLL